jgi:hypothetical protein
MYTVLDIDMDLFVDPRTQGFSPKPKISEGELVFEP